MHVSQRGVATVPTPRAAVRMVTVQRCLRTHVLGLCLLNAATFPAPPPETPTWRSRIKVPGARVINNWINLQRRLHLNHCFVATNAAGAVVGSVEVHTPGYLLSRSPMLTPEQAEKLQPYLASLAVRDDQRGRGYGRALVQAAVDEARNASRRASDQMLLQVEASNTAAIRLYEQCGFQVVSAPGCQIAMMRYRLGTTVRPTSSQ